MSIKLRHNAPEKTPNIVITKENNDILTRASKNIPNVYVQTKDHLSVLDLINGDMYVMTLDAVEAYEEDFK